MPRDVQAAWAKKRELTIVMPGKQPAIAASLLVGLNT